MRKQPIDTSSPWTIRLILAEKAFNVAIVYVFKDLKKTIFKN